MDTSTGIDYSKYEMDKFYTMKLDASDHISSMYMIFIYLPLLYHSDRSMFEGFIHGVPFDSKDKHGDMYRRSFRHLIQTDKIISMKLTERREGPLVLNWKFLSPDLKQFLFI